jgi:hypothetical protein
VTKGSDLLDKIMGREVGKRLASQKKDLVELNRKLTIAEAGQVPGLIDEMFVLWTQQIDVEPKSDIRLIDPIYGEVVIEKELSEVFLQPLVQRLESRL